MNDKILFVDDDSNILESYKRFFRRQFKIETAMGGQAGLQLLNTGEPFAVVVSDMRMPEMDGAKFLAQVREKSPDSVRMLLTGQADLNDAIAAVNEGHIFRFLTKPCQPETLSTALNAGLEQHRLIMSERDLLNKTLKGSIKLLADILSITAPEAFTRSIRIRKLATEMAERLELPNLWEVDLAALLSQIGCVTIPGEILRKRYNGQPLLPGEDEMFQRHFEVGRDLLANIPRLENVAEAIYYQEKRYNGGGKPADPKHGKQIPIIARILNVVHDFDGLVMSGMPADEAVSQLRRHSSIYDPDVLDALHAANLNAEKGFVVREIRARDVRTGMVLAEDARTRSNLLLVCRRQEISDTLRICILSFAEKGNVIEPLRILDLPKSDE
jgi:response regulator RpfG family c-di-GMP phosphodiesterase